MSTIYSPLNIVEYQDYPITGTTSFSKLKYSILADSTEDAYHKNRHVQDGLKFIKTDAGTGKEGNLNYYTHVNAVVGTNFGDRSFNNSSAADLTTYDQSFFNLDTYSFVYDLLADSTTGTLDKSDLFIVIYTKPSSESSLNYDSWYRSSLTVIPQTDWVNGVNQTYTLNINQVSNYTIVNTKDAGENQEVQIANILANEEIMAISIQSKSTTLTPFEFTLRETSITYGSISEFYPTETRSVNFKLDNSILNIVEDESNANPISIGVGTNASDSVQDVFISSISQTFKDTIDEFVYVNNVKSSNESNTQYLFAKGEAKDIVYVPQDKNFVIRIDNSSNILDYYGINPGDAIQFQSQSGLLFGFVDDINILKEPSNVDVYYSSDDTTPGASLQKAYLMSGLQVSTLQQSIINKYIKNKSIRAPEGKNFFTAYKGTTGDSIIVENGANVAIRFDNSGNPLEMLGVLSGESISFQSGILFGFLLPDNKVLDVAILSENVENSPVEYDGHILDLGAVDMTETTFKYWFYASNGNEKFNINCSNILDKTPITFNSQTYNKGDIESQFNLINGILEYYMTDLKLSRDCFEPCSVMEIESQLGRINTLCDICEVKCSLQWSEVIKSLKALGANTITGQTHVLRVNALFTNSNPSLKDVLIRFNYNVTLENNY